MHPALGAQLLSPSAPFNHALSATRHPRTSNAHAAASSPQGCSCRTLQHISLLLLYTGASRAPLGAHTSGPLLGSILFALSVHTYVVAHPRLTGSWCAFLPATHADSIIWQSLHGGTMSHMVEGFIYTCANTYPLYCHPHSRQQAPAAETTTPSQLCVCDPLSWLCLGSAEAVGPVVHACRVCACLVWGRVISHLDWCPYTVRCVQACLSHELWHHLVHQTVLAAPSGCR